MASADVLHRNLLDSGVLARQMSMMSHTPYGRHQLVLASHQAGRNLKCPRLETRHIALAMAVAALRLSRRGPKGNRRVGIAFFNGIRSGIRNRSQNGT
jgi:hypothetical protein